MKKIQVKVIPGAKKNKIIEENSKLKVYVQAPRDKGKANQALLKLLARYLAVPKSNLTIIRGQKSREKIIHILL